MLPRLLRHNVRASDHPRVRSQRHRLLDVKGGRCFFFADKLEYCMRGFRGEWYGMCLFSWIKAVAATCPDRSLCTTASGSIPTKFCRADDRVPSGITPHRAQSTRCHLQVFLEFFFSTLLFSRSARLAKHQRLDKRLGSSGLHGFPPRSPEMA